MCTGGSADCYGKINFRHAYAALGGSPANRWNCAGAHTDFRNLKANPWQVSQARFGDLETGVLEVPAMHNLYLRKREEEPWRECRALDPEEGERRYVRNVQIAKSRDFGLVNLACRWAEGEEEPWRLAAYLPPGFTVARFHERRMWIEGLPGDWQEGRFHLHQTRLYEPETLSRLMLRLSLVYVWLVAVASYVTGAGLATFS